MKARRGSARDDAMARAQKRAQQKTEKSPMEQFLDTLEQIATGAISDHWDDVRAINLRLLTQEYIKSLNILLREDPDSTIAALSAHVGALIRAYTTPEERTAVMAGMLGIVIAIARSPATAACVEKAFGPEVAGRA